MKLIIKLNRRVVAATLICALACIGACAMAWRNMRAIETTVPVEGRVVILDAGHGGEDGGAVAGDGTMEKTLNLDIALRLRDMFELAGYTVIMTRTDDSSLCQGKFNKNEDMRVRIECAAQYPDAAFVSIHLNKFSIEKVKGAQVFYSGNNDQSQELAQLIQQSIRTRLQTDNNRAITNGDANSILLRRVGNPAVIVECGFISNHAELQLLHDEEYRSSMAYCIFLGVMEFEQQRMESQS